MSGRAEQSHNPSVVIQNSMNNREHGEPDNRDEEMNDLDDDPPAYMNALPSVSVATPYAAVENTVTIVANASTVRAFDIGGREPCRYCGAKLWNHEKSWTKIYCRKGTRRCPLWEWPREGSLEHEILSIWTSQTPDGRFVRNNARIINNSLSLASSRLKQPSDGVQGFQGQLRAQGPIYHRVGALAVGEGERLRFAQLYLHDPHRLDDAIDQRVDFLNLSAHTSDVELHRMRRLLKRFRKLLQQCNNYVKDFMTITDLPPRALNGRKLVINPDAMPAEEHARRYNRPMGLQKGDLAELIRRADLIVWDEAPMSNKFHLEALDITLRDLCNSNLPFGGKVLLLSGDFRQVLPIVKHGSRAQQIDASIKMSPLWKLFEVHCLNENMQILSLGNDPMARMYDMFLMRIGNGDPIRFVPNEPAAVKLPHEICTDKPIRDLISCTFEDVCEHVGDADYFNARLILCATNDDAGCVNDMVLNDFPSESNWMFQSLLHDEYIALSNEEIARMTFHLPYCPTDGTVPEPFFRYARIQSLIKRIPVGVPSSAPPRATVRPLSLPAPSPTKFQRLADYASPSNVATTVVTASTVVSASPAAMFTPSPTDCVVPAPFDIVVYESLASIGPKNVHAHLFHLDSFHRLQDIAQAADELRTDMNTWRSVDAAIHLDYNRQRQSPFQTFEDYRQEVLQQSSVREMLREFHSTDGN
ncbi:hypothetical protein CBR_g40073 [Chara braunii]|uniref:ATP-dependent DNA helicase n=1 Tax=Chara braunii TaxID=69332 RepID=A0A388LT43_CHABU|nr:hypothetical protein CBR_g40073 [Chara braunii]|eukprot:GBG85431.1 hypothetical protein CBR_g40073 [Chara braunii]